jgi:hypothetical protein
MKKSSRKISKVLKTNILDENIEENNLEQGDFDLSEDVE